MTEFNVEIKKKVFKEIKKMPAHIQVKLAALVEDLKVKGPVQLNWQNYSRLGKDKYHCHLSRKWVACWYNKDQSINIEVYYAGSRENAPY